MRTALRLPMLAALAAAAVAGAAVPATAQDATKVSYVFEGQQRAHAGEADAVGRVLAGRQATRAWQDSVDVLLDQEMETAEGFARARAGERAQYRVSIMALPVMTADRQSTGLVAYALTLFEPGAVTAWRYVTTTVAYSTGAEAAARQIAAMTTRAVVDRAAR